MAYAKKDFYFIRNVNINKSIIVNVEIKPEYSYFKKIPYNKTSVEIASDINPYISVELEKPFITIFLDHSNSMKKNKDKIVKFYNDMLKLFPESRVKLVLFNRLAKSTPFDKPDYLPKDISYIEFKNSTRLWDTLYNEAKKQSKTIRPKYFILLSDGWDQIFINSIEQYSRHTMNETANLLLKHNIKLFCVSFGKKTNKTELMQLSRITKGYYMQKPDPKKFISILKNNFNAFFCFKIPDIYKNYTSYKERKIIIETIYNYKYKTKIECTVKSGKNKLFKLKKPDNNYIHTFFTGYYFSNKEDIILYTQVFFSKKMIRNLEKLKFNVYLKSRIDHNFKNNPLNIKYYTLIDNSGSMKEYKEKILTFIKNINKSKLAEFEYFILDKKYPFIRQINNHKINEIVFKGPTPLYDAIFTLIIKAANQHNIRRRLLIITDGWDEYYEGTHKRFSKKRAIDIINTAFYLKTKIFISPFGKITNKRTLNIISENTNGYIIEDNINTLYIPDTYFYTVSFTNPFYNIPKKAIATIKIENIMLNLIYKNKKWKIIPQS